MEPFEEMLMRHEGMRGTPYIDSLGVQTIGIGHNLHKPLSYAAVMQIFKDDVNDAKNDCLHAFSWFAELDETRKGVMINMCFNLGLSRLQGFHKFLKAMELGDYTTAATEMRQSLWATQVKGRAKELAALMEGSADI